MALKRACLLPSPARCCWRGARSSSNVKGEGGHRVGVGDESRWVDGDRNAGSRYPGHLPSAVTISQASSVTIVYGVPHSVSDVLPRGLSYVPLSEIYLHAVLSSPCLDRWPRCQRWIESCWLAIGHHTGWSFTVITLSPSPRAAETTVPNGPY